MMRHKGGDERLAHVVKKMPSIRNLHRLRRGLGHCFGVQTGSVAANDLGSRMRPQPLGGALRATVR